MSEEWQNNVIEWDPEQANGMIHALEAENAALRARVGELEGRYQIPEWAEHVELSIGVHYHEWKERGQKTWQWRRSCWGRGASLGDAIADMMGKHCVTQAAWDERVALNPHLADLDPSEGGQE